MYTSMCFPCVFGIPFLPRWFGWPHFLLSDRCQGRGVYPHCRSLQPIRWQQARNRFKQEDIDGYCYAYSYDVFAWISKCHNRWSLCRNLLYRQVDHWLLMFWNNLKHHQSCGNLDIVVREDWFAVDVVHVCSISGLSLVFCWQVQKLWYWTCSFGVPVGGVCLVRFSYFMIFWLVLTGTWISLFHILGIIIPTDEQNNFSEG